MCFAVTTAAVLLAGCAASHSSAKARAQASPSASAQLSARLLDPPTGYALASPSPDDPAGPLDASGFDDLFGGDAALSYGFRAGYVRTYDAALSDESIQLALYQFFDTTGAAKFAHDTVLDDIQPSETPVRRAIASVPGGVQVDGTTPATDGFYDHDVVARAALIVMVASYSNDRTKAASPAYLAWTTQQYRRLT